jgi:hypothetical protein
MTVQPVERVCVCPRGHVGPPHSPECNQLHREAFFAAVARTRAEFVPCQPIVALPAPSQN